ncbi:nucleoside-diphosphate-sugar epimerase [Ancylobacter sp. 3268]|uniref:NAD-dependent epimerase/dehydratase family protein n=1 Tax=Ancylobacter sp. 3268 TaxID=2817752 RepID=UPI00285465B1|nr:NAD(P)-dependent oxidoreductase [Ancylobacter sp. 3268]MDR6951192.1 nucleoside-diphosphate-sugar epimerase [Ancylobacter sp. 3268]
MTVLVTGVTGLVGSRLLPRLVEAGMKCRGLMRDGKQAPAGVSTIAADLFDPDSLIEAMEGVSAIIHLAAVFRTPDTDLIWKSNLEGTRNLIAAAKARAPDARFILASTSNIYDADSPRPGREEDAANPQQAYPASKLAAENALRACGLNWSIQRFGFVYGDGDGHLEELPRLVASLKMHPAQRMSLVHHRDIATAMKLALTGAMDGRIVNIADEAPTSIYELVGLVGGTMEPSSAPLDTPWRLHMDVSLARHLGFQPVVRTVHQAVQEKLM